MNETVGLMPPARPQGMSYVAHAWIVRVQDGLPTQIKASDQWQALMPRAARTGNDLEEQRCTLIYDWMWTALELVQPDAQDRGFGQAWRAMLEHKTPGATRAAGAAADAVFTNNNSSLYLAALAAAEVAQAYASGYTAGVADAADVVTLVINFLVTTGDNRADEDADEDAWLAAWLRIDPAGLLERLVDCEAGQ